MNRPIPGVVCAVVSKKRILLVKTKDFWELPSGAIEAGETTATAAKRVISAATGREAAITTMPGLISQKVMTKGVKEHYLLHLVIMKIQGSIGHHENTKWYYMNKINVKLAPGDIEIIDKMIANSEGTYFDCAIIDGVVSRFDQL